MYANAFRASFLFFLVFVLPFVTDAATMRTVPSSASVSVGETISVAITLTSSDQSMNAAAGVLTFPPDRLQVISLSKSGSVLGLWVQEPSFSNAAGTVNFEGVALNPGYIGSNGTVITVTFRARSAGSAALAITNGSVLANDGRGSEILTGTSGGTISIAAAETPPPRTPTPQVETEDESEETSAPTPVATSTSAPRTSIERQFDIAPLLAWVSARDGTLLLLLIALFIILDILVFFQYLRLRKREGGKLDHAQVLAHRSFLLLRDDVDKFVDELEAESGHRKLTPIESRFVKEMRGDLSDAEKTIVKELRAAEKDIH